MRAEIEKAKEAERYVVHLNHMLIYINLMRCLGDSNWKENDWKNKTHLLMMKSHNNSHQQRTSQASHHSHLTSICLLYPLSPQLHQCSQHPNTPSRKPITPSSANSVPTAPPPPPQSLHRHNKKSPTIHSTDSPHNLPNHPSQLHNLPVNPTLDRKKTTGPSLAAKSKKTQKTMTTI